MDRIEKTRLAIILRDNGDYELEIRVSVKRIGIKDDPTSPKKASSFASNVN